MELSQRVRAILSFVEASDAGSFASAARALGISSAAVSKNVASLEQALGIRLMNRTTRKLSITEEGEVFLKQARIAIEALDTAVDTVIARKMETSGHVRISTSAAFGRDQLIPVLPGLRTRYPALSVEVDFDDRVVDLVRDNYDLAIRGGRIIDSSLVSRPVCRLSMVLVASPDYLEAHGTPRIPEDLKRHNLIARRFLGGKLTPWGFRMNDGSLTTMEPDSPVLTLSAPEAQIQAACLGMGIAQVGVHHALESLRSGKLKTVLLGQHDPGSYELVIQYPHRALIAPRVRATVEYLLAAFKQDESIHYSLDELQHYS
ncbi:LysR family transcriptional regulator [Escherichia coli]|uniref:LysR family transcriptional regulator n=1 Tax=Enterobacteriaceae TaxID=543 RepID=UPI00088DD9DD|nr:MULTISPECIES: LysR family transcriptional regulator [Enterobacteriaceae]EBB9035471.1 LysR family transcriptional regulator [Salmonella enterica subsp. enterica serovar Oslo]ECF8483045.1 LysR family transcriptional regulator [Salmonella enterica]EDS7870826.1 LysR family transcriptional regulator [Salmonella enterica subsp. enterica serovar Oslo]EEZ5307456.1 LysR family transcriptional regulator [Escherichia coli]EHT7738054.1 LysR family transcriptional regulator [Escherichia coli]